MPPYGLYPIPRNHLYGGGIWARPRPRFNTMSFLDKPPIPADTPKKDLAQEVNGTAGKTSESTEKTSAKKKQQRNLEAQDAIIPETPVTKIKSNVSSSKRKIKAQDGESGTRNTAEIVKKSKRESVSTTETPTAVHNGLDNSDLVLGNAFIEKLKLSMGDLGASFDSPVQKAERVQATPKLNEKRKGLMIKPVAKPSSSTPSASTQNAPTAKNNTPASHGKTKQKKAKDNERREKKLRAREKRKLEEVQTPSTPVKSNANAVASPYTTTPRKTPVPLPAQSPWYLSDLKEKLTGKRAASNGQDNRMPIHDAPPAQSAKTIGDNESKVDYCKPVQGPEFIRTKECRRRSYSSPTRQKTKSTISATGNCLSVMDGRSVVTPSLQGGKNNQASMTASHQIQQTPSKKRPRTPISSISASPGSELSSLISPSARAVSTYVKSRSGAARDPVTDISLPGTTPPANHSKKKKKDDKKTKKKAGKKLKVSNSALQDAEEAIIHDRVLDTKLATQEDAASGSSTTAPSTLQQGVDHANEQASLASYVSFRGALAAAGAPPCLRRATGCNAKQEKLLRMRVQGPEVNDENEGKIDDTKVKRNDDHGPAIREKNEDYGDAATVDTTTATLLKATQSLTAAETLLLLSLRARVPVPLGEVTGTWSLFCPSYSAAHVDRYEGGMRTMVISRETTSPSSSMYTAYLALPPRPLPFSTQPFSLAAHASFAPTALHTAEEGYRIETVFLGSGYAVLRMDLRLLLFGRAGAGVGEHVHGKVEEKEERAGWEGKEKGKPKEGGDQKAKTRKKSKENGTSGVMEFIAVREGAVEWGGTER